MKKDELISEKLTTRNKLIAFVFLPVLMIFSFLAVYTLTMLINGGSYEAGLIVGFLIAVLFICYVANPILGAFQFQVIFKEHANLSLKEKLKVFKSTFVQLALLSAAAGLIAGFTV